MKTKDCGLTRQEVESRKLTISDADPLAILRYVCEMLEEGKIDLFEIKKGPEICRANIVLVEPVKGVMYSMELKQ